MLIGLGFRVCCLVVCLFAAVSAAGQTTEFNYHGSLKDGTGPANGSYDFEFALYDQQSGGTQFGITLSRSSVAVDGGAFAVKLDFGDQFPGASRFLEIRVRLSGQPTLTTLTPRQAVSSSPHAIKSLNAQNASNSLSLGGVAAVQFVLTGDARLSNARDPLPNSPSYIQNNIFAEAQTATINITGSVKANTVNAVTQYNIDNSRVLSIPGFENTIVGQYAGQSFTTGFFNSFFGTRAGYSNSSGHSNTFVGRTAGSQNSVGVENSFVGVGSGVANTVGNANAFFGVGAGDHNIDGVNNTFLGHHAGAASTSGSGNTVIGALANVGASGLINATAIGSNALVTASNSMVLGNGVKVGIGVSNPTYKLHINDQTNTGLRVETAGPGGTVASFGSAGNFYVDANGVMGGRLTVLENGNVGLGDPAPQNKLSVGGTLAVSVLGPAGTTPLCQNAQNQISACSSSDVIADAAQIIAAHERKIETQEQQIKAQRSEIDALKALVCLQNKDAAICRVAK